MIKMLEGFPESVIALSAHGRVTRKDYENVLIPHINLALSSHDKVRLYYELDGDFAGLEAGAAWEDFKIGLEHLSRWERIAVVTDIGWIRLAVGTFRFLMPGRIRIFDAGQASQARRWIVSDS
jgi:hypothetical protein